MPEHINDEFHIHFINLDEWARKFAEKKFANVIFLNGCCRCPIANYSEFMDAFTQRDIHEYGELLPAKLRREHLHELHELLGEDYCYDRFNRIVFRRKYSGVSLVIYGDDPGSTREGRRDLLWRFMQIYSEIDLKLRGPQLDAMKNLSYDLKTLQNYSWGIRNFIPADRFQIYYDGSFSDLLTSRLVLLLLPKNI